MQKNKEDKELNKFIKTIIESLEEIKAEEIIDLDITHLNTSICRHYIICHANSTTRVKALADKVEKNMREKHKIKPFHKEGFDNAQWVLLDYPDIIVHVFLEDQRRFYNLEDLWADGIKHDI